MMVTQTKARHILIKLSQVRDDEQAKERIEQLKQRINQGESFEVLARSNSEDSTAPQGGDLGWLTPGETVPAFEQAMDSLQPGQVSEPVRSQFGWHLIRVDDRRTKNMENEYRRMQARQHLFEQRVEPALDDWLSQLRGSVYIDNRLEKALSSEQ
jgi:peptidyl-prolyl cis-trans isomerase SurA